MHAIVLGAAAGGGLPQWNCGCSNCRLARAGDPEILASTQCSLAVSADRDRWVLLNVSPDVTVQIARTRSLHPGGSGRHSPIAAAVLTGGEVDSIAGLLSLREGHAFALYGSPPVLRVLAANPIFDALPPSRVPRRDLPFDTEFALTGPADDPLGLWVTAFTVPGKIPLFAEVGDDPGQRDDGTTIGLEVRSQTRSLIFIPGCAMLTPELRARVQGAGLVLFDGTLWRDDELIHAGLGMKTGARMGHMSISGADGTIAAFADLGVRRRIFIHLNNTNPAWRAGSAERREITAAGWEVAADGMELFT